MSGDDKSVKMPPFISLPYLKKRYPGGSSENPVIDANGRVVVGLNIKLYDDSGNSREDKFPVDSKTITIRGPGDVVGISPASIARTDPVKGTTDFEPNYFPFVEFIDPDFPWRYSIDSDDDTKMTPWIALIVLKDEEILDFEDDTIPAKKKNQFIKVDKIHLPKIKDLWATAHVHLIGIENIQGNIESEIIHFPV